MFTNDSFGETFERNPRPIRRSILVANSLKINRKSVSNMLFDRHRLPNRSWRRFGFDLCDFGCFGMLLGDFVVPRRPPGRSRSSPGDSRGGPGAPQETPKPPQETPKPPPERPKALQEASRAASGTLGGGPGCLRTSFWRFRTMFLQCNFLFLAVFPVRKIGTFALLPSYLLLFFLLLDPKSS